MSIVGLGTIFSSFLRHDLGQLLALVPQLKAHAPQIINAVRQGQTSLAFSAVPKALRGQLEGAVKSSFASGITSFCTSPGRWRWSVLCALCSSSGTGISPTARPWRHP